MIDSTKKWTHPFPIWTGRPDSDGTIGTYTIPLWFFLVFACVVTLAIFVGALTTIGVSIWLLLGLL
jgi:hypothetical protein